MDAEKLKKFESILKEKEEQLSDDLKSVEEQLKIQEKELTGSLVNFDQNHPAETATMTFEKERLLTERQELSFVLKEVKHALWKIKNNPESFGVCEHCGKLISEDRLEAKPWARYCGSCKKKIEQNQA